MVPDQQTDVLHERPEVLLGERRHNVQQAVAYMASTVDRLEIAAGANPVIVPVSPEVQIYAPQSYIETPAAETVKAPEAMATQIPATNETDTLVSVREQVEAAYDNPLLNRGQQ